MNGFNRYYSNETSECPCLLKHSRWVPYSDSPDSQFEWICEQFEVYFILYGMFFPEKSKSKFL